MQGAYSNRYGASRLRIADCRWWIAKNTRTCAIVLVLLLVIVLVTEIRGAGDMEPTDGGSGQGLPETPQVQSDKALDSTGEEKEIMVHLLKSEQWGPLSSKGWTDRVGNGMGVWVSVKEQMLRVIQGTSVLFEAPCSTAAKGSGSKANSFQTPLGWHSIAEKFGEGAPWGRVFREKRITDETWKRGDPVKEDLVLTRVLSLRGEEQGKNSGGDVDSFDRNIYIHGTNDEQNIGKPVSHGCVRLTNDDVIAVYDIIPLNTLVLITEE